jgi:hypothetical protein
MYTETMGDTMKCISALNTRILTICPQCVNEGLFFVHVSSVYVLKNMFILQFFSTPLMIPTKLLYDF